MLLARRFALKVRCSTATACRSMTPCWKCGRRTRRAVTPIRATAARDRTRNLWDLVPRQPIKTRLSAFTPSNRSPARVRGPKGSARAPHIVFCTFAGGRRRQIHPRLYFADEAANESDPILTLVPSDRRGTLIAHKELRGDLRVYRFNIRVQGESETV